MISIADVRIAARSLTRNRRRAVTGMLTIAAGVVAMVLADGFVQWVFWAMRESSVRAQLGHIQVVRQGYASAGAADPFAYLLPGRAPELKAIESLPGVQLVVPRLSVSGLISHGETTVAFVGDGVVPEKEVALSRAFAAATGIQMAHSSGVVEGHDLSGSSAKEVILGRGLAQNLGVRPGDTVVLLANTTSRGINAVEAKVAGLFVSASKAYDDSALRLPLGLAHTLLRADGVHMWLVLLEHTEATDALTGQLRARFPAQATRLEFLPWHARADFYNKTVALFSRQMDVVRAVIGVIIVLSISNMLLMNVLERVGEIGTLMAIGLKRGKILELFAIECLLLGLVGGGVGILAGYGLGELISVIGIPMPPPPGMDRGYSGEIRLTWDILARAFLIAVVTTALAGLYPAWKASRLRIVDALRQNV